MRILTLLLFYLFCFNLPSTIAHPEDELRYPTLDSTICDSIDEFYTIDLSGVSGINFCKGDGRGDTVPIFEVYLYLALENYLL